VVYWCNSYTISHCSLGIIEWFKYKLKNVFKLYLILIHPPLSINRSITGRLVQVGAWLMHLFIIHVDYRLRYRLMHGIGLQQYISQ
jgi:hypothetical protein